MDDWKAVLGHVQKLLIIWLSLRKFTPIPKGRYGGGDFDQEGLWSVFQESVDYNLEVLKIKLLQQRYIDVL